MRRRRQADDLPDVIEDWLSDGARPSAGLPECAPYAFLVVRPDGTVLGFLPEFEDVAIGTARAVGGALVGAAVVADYSRPLDTRPSSLVWSEPGAGSSGIPPTGPVHIRQVEHGPDGWTVTYERPRP